MRAAEVQWDLSGMGWDKLLSEATILFLGKVLAAASLVAFGPALVLEYVPTSKVDVRDMTSASSTEGRTQRLLLAFAGGGLMAEAALHLLPHLFMPHHDDDHGHGDGHKPLGDACTLIAVGFLAAFAIDRFVGVRQQQQQQQQQQKNHQPEQKVELEEMDPAAVTTAGTHAAAALEVLRGGGDVAAAEEIAVTAGVAGAADATESTEAAAAAGVAALTQEEGAEEETREACRRAEEPLLPEAAEPAAAAAASEDGGDGEGGQGEGRGGEGAGEEDDGPREFVSSSSATDVDEGSAAGAMLASAHMTQTPEKRPPAQPAATAATAATSADSDDALKIAPEETVPVGGTPQPSPEVPPAAAAFSAEAAAPSSEPASGAPSAGTTPPPPPSAGSPELTRYGNPRDGAVDATAGSEQEGPSDGHCAVAVGSKDAAVTAGAKGMVVAGGGGDVVCSKVDHHHDHHHDHHGPADAGAYVTLAVDFLHNLIDGIGIGAAYAVGGDVIGHTTAVLKLVHEVQHEIGDVTALVQCGMSKHHAIHIQHTTAAGVFLGVAISLGAGAFPEGLLASCLALSAGATFHLASGTVLGPVLAIPADVGGPVQGLLEVAALAAGAAGVVAVGLAEGWAGIGH